MQTFMPYSDYVLTAKSLDRQRLGKQRVEAWQILRTLTGQSSQGWVNHPATKMWRGYEPELTLYAIAICEEWIRRGYKDTMLERFDDFLYNYSGPDNGRPWWVSNKRLNISHRSNLIRKLPTHYGPQWPNIPDDMPYYWPVP